MNQQPIENCLIVFSPGYSAPIKTQKNKQKQPNTPTISMAYTTFVMIMWDLYITGYVIILYQA